MRPDAASMDEEMLLESLDNLDMLLANMKSEKGKAEILGKLGVKLGIEKPKDYLQPFALGVNQPN